MSSSKLDYLQKYMLGHQETSDYAAEPLKKKKKKKKKVLQINNAKIIDEEEEILKKTSKNVENQEYEKINNLKNNNNNQYLEDNNSNNDNDIDENIDEEELPQFEDTDANLRNFTDEQKREILKKGLKSMNQQKQDIENDQKSKTINQKPAGKWVEIKNKSRSSSSSNSSSDSDSESEVRRRIDSSDSDDRRENEEEQDNILKNKLNKALGLDSDDSDMNVKRKKRKDSDSSSGSDRMAQIRKQQKINQNRATVRNEFGQVIDVKDLKNIVSKEDDLKLLQEAQISRFAGGMKQKNDRKEQEEEQRLIREGKYANYDPKKEQELHMIRKKIDGDNMGKIIQAEEEKKLQKLKGGNFIAKKCPHTGPPNRFNILPGHRWDGVDRSNGYEVQIFNNQNQKKRQYDEQYEKYQKDL